MKPILLATLSFFLFALTTHFSLTFTQDIDKVKDTYGNPLVPGAKYYILPTTSGRDAGGELKLGKTIDQKCPLTVLQDYSETFIGLPVKFNVRDGKDFISVDFSNIDIEFDTKPECAHSSKWVLVKSYTFLQRWIGIGSIEDIEASYGKVIKGVFNIEKHGLGYKLVYVIDGGGSNDIASSIDVNGRRLVVPEEFDTFEVKLLVPMEMEDL
jgi:hypothetical protein